MVMRKLHNLVDDRLIDGMVSFAQKTSDKTNMINERNQIQQELKEIQNALNAERAAKRTWLNWLR